MTRACRLVGLACLGTYFKTGTTILATVKVPSKFLKSVVFAVTQKGDLCHCGLRSNHSSIYYVIASRCRPRQVRAVSSQSAEGNGHKRNKVRRILCAS